MGANQQVMAEPLGETRAADRARVNARLARSSTALGVIALVGALVATLVDQAWLVLASGAVAIFCVVLLLLARRDAALSEATSPALDDEPPRPDEPVDDEAKAAAARFEADAIRAREELMAILREERRKSLGATATVERGEPVDADVDQDIIWDPVSGLFSEEFFSASLVKRVSAARRGLRPLSVAVLDVWTGFGTPEAAQAPPVPVAKVMLEVFREADTIARAQDGLYHVLLEDTPENGAVWSLERLRRKVAEALPGHTTWAGVSCYPAYAFDAEHLVGQARNALALAKEWPQDRVEVTSESPD